MEEACVPVQSIRRNDTKSHVMMLQEEIANLLRREKENLQLVGRLQIAANGK